MGSCCSDTREKPIQIVEAQNARDCVEKYKNYQRMPKELKEKMKAQHIYQFQYKENLYEIINIYEEPVKIPDPLFINLEKDEWEKYILKNVNLDSKKESMQNKVRMLVSSYTDLSEQEYVLMMNLENKATQQLHEKQVRFFEKLNHPNLVKYISHTKINFQLTVFKEICAQGSLMRYLERNRRFLNADLIFDLIEDLCSAMRYLYSRAVVDFELSLDMLYVSNNTIKIDLYNCIKIDDRLMNQLQQQDEGNNSNPPSFNNLILTSRVVLPAADYLDTPQHAATKSNQKSRIGFEEQSRTIQKIQKKYKVDENQLDIQFIRLFCLYLLFKQDYRILLKQKQDPNSQQENISNNINVNGEEEQKTYRDVDVNKIKYVKRAPKALQEFIVWTMHHISTLRPNISELHKEISKIRYQPDVVSYINSLYQRNSSKTINAQNSLQENVDDEKLNGYQSHYAKQHAEELQRQHDSERAMFLQNYQDHVIQTYNPNNVENTVQNNTVQNTKQQTNTMQNSQNMEKMSGSFNNMMDSQNRGSQNIIKIWEEIGDVQVEKIRSNYNPNELLKVQFQFFEETYEIVSYLGNTELSVLFRIENIFTNRQKAFTLKIAKNEIFNLFIEKEYTILKQFGCQNMITTFSHLNINNLSGLVLDLYHQNLHDYLTNSSKLDYAKQILELLFEMLNGLHELHVKNIVHRQLSLESVAILPQTSSSSYNNQPIAALSNLEFAIQLKNTDKISGKVPLNQYSSPEMRENEPYGLASDIYSAGMIIISTLCNVSTQKLLATAYPELLPPPPKANMYVSHVQDPNALITKSNYQKALEQSQIKKNNPTQTQSLSQLPNNNNHHINEITQSKIQQNNNVLSSTIKQQGKSMSNINASKIGQEQSLQATLNASRLESSRVQNKQNNRYVTLREIVGDKCPQIIIDSFENMISKYPQLRGNCSDYLNEFDKLKYSPEVINYINMQNKQIRFF